MRSIWELANTQLRDLRVYEPGKPIEETARELGIDSAAIVKLASNENPLGPSLAAVRAMQAALSESQLYPDGSAFNLTKAIADHLHVTHQQVILGNGSNEIIEFMGHAFLSRGDSIVVSQYSFIAYKIIATLFGATVIEVPTEDYRQ